MPRMATFNIKIICLSLNRKIEDRLSTELRYQKAANLNNLWGASDAKSGRDSCSRLQAFRHPASVYHPTTTADRLLSYLPHSLGYCFRLSYPFSNRESATFAPLIREVRVLKLSKAANQHHGGACSPIVFVKLVATFK
jgi:hypothetical protein